MKRQTVLIVHNYYQIPGGEDTVVAAEKRMLEKNGHKVLLYTRNNAELKEFGKIQKLFLPFSTVFNVRTYREIRRLIKKEKIDVVHVHNTLNLVSPSVYYAARSRKIPVVQTIHNFRFLCPGATFYRDGKICEECVSKGLKCAVKYRCYRGSRLQTLACVISAQIHRFLGIYGKLNYICLTDFNKEKLLGLKQISPEQVYVKPNFAEPFCGMETEQQISDTLCDSRKSADTLCDSGKDTNELCNSGKSADSDADKSRAQKAARSGFVFAGRLDKQKGVKVLLEAWKRMGAKAPELVVCGTGPEEAWCRKYIETNRLTSVKMQGFVENQAVKKIIAASKALILPTQWYEGFPMSILEAFSVGTPVIGSDIGNVGNIVINGVNGYKFCYNSSRDLAEKILAFQEIEPEKIMEYSRERYSAEANYKILKRIYDRVTKDR